MTQADPLLLYGTAQVPPQARLLAAGRLTAEFADGALANIRFDGVEIVRAIAWLVRDANWGTLAPRLSGLEIDQRDDGFDVRYDARCEGPGDQRIAYSAHIAAVADGRLSFSARYHAETEFIACRNGFCVLHPAALAGAPVTVTHTDGIVQRSTLPELVAPWQPFRNIRELAHPVAPGLAVTCRFDGDVFEMEDHRNWSDASFKTYVRPLALPWPYVLPPGESGQQRVDLRVDASGTPGACVPEADDAVSLALAPAGAVLPAIGLLVTPEETAATLERLDDLRALGPQHLLCHFDPCAGHGVPVLEGYARLAASYPCRTTLECVVPGVTTPAEELAAIAAQLAEAGFKPDGIALCPSVDRRSVPPGSPWPPCPALADIYRAARTVFPGTPIGGGMFSYFTELNRKRPPVGLLDWVTHATNPIVHAADDRSVMQTLEALPHITRSCRAIIGATPYRLGPVTLAMRQNPYGTHTVDNPDGRRIPMANGDPRSQARFGAAWLLGYAAQVAAAGLDVLTLGPLTGPRGLLGPAGRYPAFAIAAALASLAGRHALPVSSSAPDRVLALGASDGDRRELWAANLTGRVQRCRLPEAAGIRVALADAGPVPIMAGHVDLPPHACLHARWRA